MWWYLGICHWGSLSKTTDYENLPTSGFKIPNTVNTGHSSQHGMNGPLSSMSWRFQSHSDTGHFRCQRGTWSQCTHYQSLQWHIRSYGCRYVSISQDEDSMEGRHVLHHEVSTTEAVQIIFWSYLNNWYSSCFSTYPRSFPQVENIYDVGRGNGY